MKKSSWRWLAGISIVACVSACSDDSSPPPTGKTGSTLAQGQVRGSGSWALHPDALVATDIDEAFVYDATVTADKIILPIAGHEALLSKIIPGKTVLVSRGNEEDMFKNPGVMSGILTMTRPGDGTAVMAYKRVPIANIVRGNIMSGADAPVFHLPKVLPQGVTRPQASPHVPLKWDKNLRQTFGSVDIDLTRSLDFGKDSKKTLKNTTPNATPANSPFLGELVVNGNVSGNATAKGSFHFSPFAEFAIDVDLDVPWLHPWDIDVDLKTFRAGIGVEYEVQAGFEAMVAGKLTGSISGSYGNWGWPCTIGGVPCTLGLNLTWDCTATVEGAATFKTNPNLRIYGTPELGFEYSDGNFRAIQGDFFNMEAPGLTIGMPDGLQVKTNNVNILQAGIETTGSLTCHPIVFQPDFTIGPSWKWGPVHVGIDAGVGVSVYPEFNAKIAHCVKWGVNTQSMTLDSYNDWGFDGHLKIDINPHAEAEAGPFGVHWSDSFNVLDATMFTVGNPNATCSF